MIQISESQLFSMCIHKVGNKHKGESYKASNDIYEPDERLTEVLQSYFLKPFNGMLDGFKFTHPTALQMNEVYQLVRIIFEDPNMMLNQSHLLLDHLYNQSTHPHIKSGEFYVTYFKNIILDGELVDAVGLYKSEKKDNFFQFSEHHDGVRLALQNGVHSKKLDKGCLIFNTEESTGYRVFTVDNNNYDTQYWNDFFLNLKPDMSESFVTKQTVDLVKSFSEKVVAQTEDKVEQAVMLKKSSDYLQQNDTFQFETFAEAVFETPELKESFKDYSREYAKEHKIETFEKLDDFEISKPALNKVKNKMKSLIKLDTNMSISLNFTNPESAGRFLEKGYDEVKGMNYYKVFYNEEVN